MKRDAYEGDEGDECDEGDIRERFKFFLFGRKSIVAIRPRGANSVLSIPPMKTAARFSSSASTRARTHRSSKSALARQVFLELFVELSPHDLTLRNCISAGLPAPPVEAMRRSDLDCFSNPHDHSTYQTAPVGGFRGRAPQIEPFLVSELVAGEKTALIVLPASTTTHARTAFSASDHHNNSSSSSRDTDSSDRSTDSLTSSETTTTTTSDSSAHDLEDPETADTTTEPVAALIDADVRARTLSAADAHLLARALCPQSRGPALLLGDLARGTLYVYEVFALDGENVGERADLNSRLDQLRSALRRERALAMFGKSSAHCARRPRIMVKQFHTATRSNVAALMAHMYVRGQRVDALERFDTIAPQDLEQQHQSHGALFEIDVDGAGHAPVAGLAFTPRMREAHRYRTLKWTPHALVTAVQVVELGDLRAACSARDDSERLDCFDVACVTNNRRRVARTFVRFQRSFAESIVRTYSRGEGRGGHSDETAVFVECSFDAQLQPQPDQNSHSDPTQLTWNALRTRRDLRFSSSASACSAARTATIERFSLYDLLCALDD